MSKNREIAETVEYIICETIRGPHIEKMSHEELKKYIQHVGIALHGLPMSIATGEKPNAGQISEIDNIDPGKKQFDSIGPLASSLLEHFKATPGDSCLEKTAESDHRKLATLRPKFTYDKARKDEEIF